jgi:hypothetical protein
MPGRSYNTPLVVVWERPYRPPQDSIGILTLREAANKLGLTGHEIRKRLNHSGVVNTEKYHAEWESESQMEVI